MSTNRKNRTGPAMLRNLVRGDAVTKRNLLVLSAQFNQAELSTICDELNSCIQQLNCEIAERSFPYFSIHQTTDPQNISKTRVVLRTEEDYQAIKNVCEALEDDDENTHLVEVFLNSCGYLEIGYTDVAGMHAGELDGCVLADFEYLPCVLIDIFLDSTMFSSYSFLKKLSPTEKRQFNQTKVEYIINKFGPLTSARKRHDLFYTFLNSKYSYLSLAFFARKSEEEVDLAYLAALWDELVNSYFEKNKHTPPPVEEQLKCFSDYGQLSPLVAEQLRSCPPGTYWLLRICRDCSGHENAEKQLDALFGSHEIGKTKIIKFSNYYLVERLVQERWITAIKIIVP